VIVDRGQDVSNAESAQARWGPATEVDTLECRALYDSITKLTPKRR
jgi:hypothetical protein